MFDLDRWKEIWETIGHLAESRTLIIISHRMSSVQTADCIYVLRDWKIAESGTHEELIAQNGIFTHMWKNYSEAAEWKIVSVFKTNTYDNQGKLFNYLRGDFDSAEDKMQFYYDVMKRSMVNTGDDLPDNDKTVLLSPCSYEYEGFRTVIVARKVRDGEDATGDTS